LSKSFTTSKRSLTRNRFVFIFGYVCVEFDVKLEGKQCEESLAVKNKQFEKVQTDYTNLQQQMKSETKSLNAIVEEQKREIQSFKRRVEDLQGQMERKV
jgi:predicted RNase H-like nuclease (RuvC/YqgF family)